MKRFLLPFVASVAMLVCISPALGVVVLTDSLNGSTSGTRSGGTFTGGGWQVTAQYDTIYWHVGTYAKGSFQYNVIGLGNTCPGGTQVINELSEMYDYTFGGADFNYNGGYRDDPYKHFIRKQCYYPKSDQLEILWQVLPNYLEDDTSTLSWSAGTTYTFRNEWENVGGNAVHRAYRNGVQVINQSVAGSWNPAGQSVRIAASPRRFDEGAHIGAIYTNVQVEDLTNAIPGAPSITAPGTGETVNTTVVYVQWTGDSHTAYHLRVCSGNNPDTGIIYDSQQTTSNAFYAWSGTLFSGSSYYAFVRLGASAGWGSWSTGRNFTVNTSFVPPGADIVQLKGNSVVKNSGPFNALGFTYMQALRRCKYDRARFTSDLAFMAANEFKYMRALSMVGWYSAWIGKEIAPVTFTAHDGYVIQAWPDYWQQFRDMIDIAYDTYGIRTELTIFADAQLMPNKSTRIAHMQTVLDNLVGREHKIMHLEVCNEAWQNGFPDAQGVSDLREFCQYLTDRTNLLVAISDSQGEGSVTEELYSGSTADICTEHFSRDMSIEGGWVPVRDPFHLEFLSGVPVGSNNEPIGPGSSVAQDTDPIRLVMNAAHTWGVNLPLFVFHSEAGVFGVNTFQSAAAVGQFIHLDTIMPPDIASWVRNDGKESTSPFTNFSMGQANKWWPEVGGSTNGCDRNYAKIKGPEFMSFPIGILSGGLTIESRRPMNFQVYNPLTGAVAYSLVKNAGEQTTLAQGPRAYIIKGFFTDVPGGGSFGAQVSIDLGTTNSEIGLSHPQVADGDTSAVTIGGRNARQTVAADDNYMYFIVSDGYAFQGNKPNQFINVDYYDTGTGTMQLQYDATDGNAYKSGPSVTFTNTNTWKTVVWNVTDAYFGNRQNNGADFRISRDPIFHLDKLAVYQKAFGGTPVSIPGIVEAENFDNGGEDISYNDTDVGNNGAQYRLNENVDIEISTDIGGGYNVGWVAPTEYLNYQVNVASAANYDITVRAASGGSGGTFHIDMNGANVTGTQTIPATGGWQTYTTVNIPNISLSAGVQTLKFTVDSGGYNLNYIALNGHQGPFGGTNRAIPGLIQAEDFDTGGQGTAYSDVTPTNDGGQYRTGDQVDIEATTDTGGGYNVGFTEPGEWLEYTVNVNTTGDYAIKVRAASGGVGGSFHFSIDGANITSTKAFATTGGWQNWTTIIVPGIFLSAGNNKILRLTIDDGGWNINSVDFAFMGADIVSEDLDVTNVDDGMTQPQAGDGNTVATAIGGHNCRANVSPSADFYMYFTVADAYALNGNKNSATVTFDYYDSGTGSYSLQYDGASNPYTISSTTVALTNTNTWKTGSITVSDAYFGNRQNSGADFRIARGTGATFYIDTVMVFATAGGSPPGQASNPSPANSATGVALNGQLSWTAGSGATSHDVRFGTTNPPPFIQNQVGLAYNPGTLAPSTVYYWRIDAKNGAGTTNGTVWSFTTTNVTVPTLNVKGPNGTITINGSSSDWVLGDFVTKVRGGEILSGDIGLVGFDGGGTVYRGNYAGVLPTNAADHTAKVYARHDATYLYLLVRCDDNQIQTQNGVSSNWANDCVEIYLDPTNNGGSTAISNSTSDIQLVIDAANQKNVYMCTGGYTTQVLAGVTSAVTTDGTGWWLEARITKTALDGDIPSSGGTIGLDFNFRDNDNNNDAALTTVYTWAETSAAGFPSKIPDHWGDAALATIVTPPGQATNPSPSNGATLVPITSTLSWTAGSGTTSHDVRFGTANPPPFVQNQAGTTYNPGTTTPNTTYYWRIDEVNSGGTTTGVVWSFTTLPLPGLASAPNPTNAATLVDRNANVSWTAGNNAASHDVRFGTANPPPFVVNQTGITYEPGTLAVNTTYFWRIDEKNTSGTTTGTVWSFTTLPVPGAASAPNPANSATLVEITTDLIWTSGSNAATHDVRFGTTNPPPFVVNQTATTYDPTLNPNTTYFWRIDEINTSGTTTGTVWSFTTLPVPGAASAPNPANSATGVSVSPTLSWTAGSNAVNRDVRFGTVNPPPFVITQTGTTFAPGTLSGNTTYFWRIDERNSSGTTTGTVWSFTTAASVPNYIVNSSFESGFGAAGGGYNGSKGNNWTPYVYTGVAGDLTFADETGAGNTDSGSHSQKITAGAAKEGGVYNQFAVTSGLNYTVTVRVKSASPTGWCFLGVHPSGNTNSHDAGMQWPMDNGRSTSWTTLTWSGTATGSLITVFLDTYDGAAYWDTATPGAVTINNSAFPSNSDGWNIVVWKSGFNADGTMIWASSFGNPTGHMYSQGVGITNNGDSCTREGGEINKAVSTAGYNGLVQVVYDIRMETDQTGTTCTGSCTGGVLEGNCADKVVVYYSTTGTGGPWTILETVNASSITQNVWSTRTINCPAAANNKANFAVRLRWQFNHESDGGRLDNVKVIATP